MRKPGYSAALPEDCLQETGQDVGVHCGHDAVNFWDSLALRSQFMDSIMEGRESDSPYIDTIWRGVTGSNYQAVCPADEHWNLFFSRYKGKTRIAVEGPLTQAKRKSHPEGVEFLVIRFKLGIFLPIIPITSLLDGDAVLPEASNHSFWLDSMIWTLPDFENAETFVTRMVRTGLLIREPVIDVALTQGTPHYSMRTVRRRFLQATGLTPVSIRQIERARQAATMLRNGTPILDAVYAAGYSDQPHMTRSLRRFIGQTPAQIAGRS
jgi:AraC-like DNA-binding protein